MRKIKYFVICIVFLLSCSTIKDDSRYIRNPGPAEFSNFTSQIRPVKGNPESHYTLARYYQDRGMHKKAIEQLEKSIEIDPTYWRAYNAMGVSYDRLTNYSRAIESYEKALKLNPESYAVLNNMGYSYMMQGNAVLATTLLKKASDMKPDSIRIKNNLGLASAMIKPSSEKVAAADVTSVEATKNVIENGANFSLAVPVLKDSLASVSQMGIIAKKTEEPKTEHMKQQSVPQQMKLEPIPQEKVVVQKRSSAIEISNGNGVRGMAKSMRAYLRKDGYKVTRVTNAKKFNHPQTSIYYVEANEVVARQIASKIPNIKQIRKIQKMDRPDIKVKLLLGKDLRNPKKKFSKEAI